MVWAKLSHFWSSREANSELISARQLNMRPGQITADIYGHSARPQGAFPHLACHRRWIDGIQAVAGMTLRAGRARRAATATRQAG
jgi:hypothetical protein